MYASMAVSALAIEFVLGALGLIPGRHGAKMVEESSRLNHTTVLNIIFLALAGILVWRFLRTSGLEMLRMMRMPNAKRTTSHGSGD